VIKFYFAFFCRSVAFAVRAFAAAFDALIALARRSSALNFSARACPPMRPRALIASDTRLILRLLVMYFFGVFPFMLTSYSVRYGEASLTISYFQCSILTSDKSGSTSKVREQRAVPVLSAPTRR
jgi:hypothetical protein